MTFNQHLIKNKKKIIRLKSRNLNNSSVIALILVETYYRKWIFRLFEYIYWIVSSDIEVTIGLSQIKVKYIKTLKGLNAFQKVKYIIYMESYIDNYFLVKQYIDKNINTGCNDTKLICRTYNGIQVSKHYIEFFENAKSYVDSVKC